MGERKLIERATAASAFKVTNFAIYDQSTLDICNRLIIVEPFQWYILNRGTRLYVLTTEMQLRCASNTIAAVNISPDGRYNSLCMPGNINVLLQEYRKYKRFDVPYELPLPNIDGTVIFTIFSAIRLLSKMQLLEVKITNYTQVANIHII